MKTLNGVNNIKVTIVCCRDGWFVFNNVNNEVVFPRLIKSGLFLVVLCTKHKLTITNPESLTPALRANLDAELQAR